MKKGWALFILLGVVIFAACNDSEEKGKAASALVQRTDTHEVENQQMGAFGGTKEVLEIVEDRQEAETAAKPLVIYYSNAQADGLETETVVTQEITPEMITGYLEKHNIVPIGTKVNQLTAAEEDGIMVLNVDFSKAFLEYLKTMGSKGETVIIAAVTNTFLGIYQADALRLTVDGTVMQTSHRRYEKLLTFQDGDHM